MLFAAYGAAASELTSVDVADPFGAAGQAKVTVANALTGIPVASGVTDPFSGRFSFTCQNGLSLVVAVLTTSGYVGAGQAMAGDNATVLANISVSDLALNAASHTPPAAVTLDATALLDPGHSVVGARFAVARWTSFASVAYGTVGSDGLIHFSVPAAMEDVYLLCVVWQDGQAARLKAIHSTSTGSTEGGGEDGAFPQF